MESTSLPSSVLSLDELKQKTFYSDVALIFVTQYGHGSKKKLPPVSIQKAFETGTVERERPDFFSQKNISTYHVSNEVGFEPLSSHV